jgi:MFS transporter, ACS family, hexuronate transporter
VMPGLAVAYGWQAGFVFAAALAFVVCGLAAALYRDPAPPHAAATAAASEPPPRAPAAGADRFAVVEIDQGLPAVTGDARADRAALESGFIAVLKSRDILLMGLAALFLGMVEFAALAHLVLFLHSAWGYTVAVAAGMLAFCQFAGAIGKPLSGLVSDRMLHRRRVPALLGMGALAALSCAAMALADPGSTSLLWVILFVLGFGAVGWGGLMGTLAGETGGRVAAGAAAGVSAAFFNVGIFLGPPLFGYIVDRTGSYVPAWWALTASAVVSLVLLAFVRERRHA